MTAPLLELKGVKTHFPVYRGTLIERRVGSIKAVDGVSLTLERGEVLGLVGESGCGKSTLVRGIVQLAPITKGDILFQGQSLQALSARDRRKLCPQIQIIFQDPFASLNPRMTVFDTLAEPMRVHGLVPRCAMPARVRALMDQVGLAAKYVKKYPHEFSGGQRQRIAIARALALTPRLILADEPVSALDVSVQAQILNLLEELSKQSDLTMMLVSHDLAVVRRLARRIAVMYLGRIVEIGPGEGVFNAPLHPYTQALLSAIPVPDPDRERARTRTLLRGGPPSPLNPPPGCPFHPRCPIADAACAETVPKLAGEDVGHWAACLKLRNV